MPDDNTNDANVVLFQISFVFLLVVAFQVAVAKFHIQKEAKRRWQHGVTGQTFIIVSYVLPLRVCISALLTGAFGMYYVRKYHKGKFFELFGELLRAEEKSEHAGGMTTMPGAFYFLLGTALTASLFPINTARYAVECLAIADPIAAYAGQSIPSPKLNQSSSVSGSVACFLTAIVVGYIYLSRTTSDEGDSARNSYNYVEAAATPCWRRVIVGAAACSLSEMISIIGLNDNLQIPLVTAAAVHAYDKLVP